MIEWKVWYMTNTIEEVILVWIIFPLILFIGCMAIYNAIQVNKEKRGK